jgi:hypothetical protein
MFEAVLFNTKGGALRDSTIFLVDCTKSMFSTYDDKTYFEKCMGVNKRCLADSRVATGIHCLFNQGHQEHVFA